jgi:DNA-directed RNA polymerase specialized sigma24 family protein
MDEIAALLEPHIPALRRYAWALLRDADAADDLVQDTLAQLEHRGLEKCSAPNTCADARGL